MNFITLWIKTLLLSVALVLAACAPLTTTPVQPIGQLVDHIFEFDAFRDSQDVEILQYRYGNGGGFNTESTPDEILSGKGIFSANTTGEMLVGKDLYVKWRIKTTGRVMEDTVELSARLPSDMKRHRLRFIVEGENLYVYVISREQVRPYFSKVDSDRIRGSARTPRERALVVFARNRVTMIYPEKQIDPHIPAEFRK